MSFDKQCIDVKDREDLSFCFSIKQYRNEALDVFLDVLIEDLDRNKFKAVISLKCTLEIEPDLCVKDVYTEYLGIKIEKNKILPDHEIDFYTARRHYKMSQYSKTAQILAE